METLQASLLAAFIKRANGVIYSVPFNGWLELPDRFPAPSDTCHDAS